MGLLSKRGNGIFYESYGEKLWIVPYGENCVRFRSTMGKDILEENWNLMEPGADSSSVEISPEKAVLKNGNIRAEILSNGCVCYYKADGSVLLEEDWPDERNQIAYQHFAREYRHKGGDLYETRVYFRAVPDESLYGLGQDPNDCFDLKGTTTELCQKNTHVCIPFLLSSKGYGFLWNSPAAGRVETVKNHTMWYLEAAAQVDYLVIAEESPMKIVQHLSDITGKTPEFPEWASGYWQCKLRYETQEDLLEAARGYKKRGIPISVIVIDFFHWTEEGDWKFDPRYWPDPKAMVEELKEMGIHLVVSIWPTVSKKSENYRWLAERGELLRAECGSFSLNEEDSGTNFIDATNPRTRQDVWQVIKKNYYDLGGRSFWLDVAEPEARPYRTGNMRAYLGNGLQMAQIYPYCYEQMFYEGLKAQGETEIISLSRSAWIGSQRWGTLVWSGDIPSTFDSLRRQIKAGMNMSLCGIPWWTTDIGGFIGGKPSDPVFRELLIRWFQFGLFLPVMRMHGCRVWDEGQHGKHTDLPCPTGADNEVWSYGEEMYEQMVHMIRLREKLRPYIMKNMSLATQEGTPVMRPLFLDYPKDKTCYALEDEYLFGPDILVAPVAEYGSRSRQVYLPEGEWIQIGSNEVIAGGQTVTMDAPLSDIPAYVRAESEVCKAITKE